MKPLNKIPAKTWAYMIIAIVAFIIAIGLASCHKATSPAQAVTTYAVKLSTGQRDNGATLSITKADSNYVLVLNAYGPFTLSMWAICKTDTGMYQVQSGTFYLQPPVYSISSGTIHISKDRTGHFAFYENTSIENGFPIGGNLITGSIAVN